MDSYKKSRGGLYVPKDVGDFESPWLTRIESANKFYQEWEGKFKCKLLEEYYEGFQWKQRRDYPTTNYNPYTLNLVYSTIKIKLASLLFQRPKFLISPRPGNSQWDQDFAVDSAQLKEDILNTIITNPNTNFTKQVKLAAMDSFFRFGLIEVGYANDWRNPHKIDPELKSWKDSTIDFDEDKVVEETPLPINERFYVKRIHPKRFRVSVSDACDLSDHDWVGYYDFYPTRTLMNTKGLKWPDSYGGQNYVSAEFASGFVGAYGSNTEDIFKKLYEAGELSKVWHIWDQVAGERLLLLEDDEMHELWKGDIETLPLIDLRWDLRLSGFYPIPPVFQWLSPQDEINEAREQVRSYRRRFTRKFQSVKGQVTEEEKEKFASGPDGIIIETKIPDAIKAIDNPEIGPTSENALILAKDDFNIVSGTSAEARGQNSDRETATQAKLVDARSQIRESAEQLDFSQWLSLIGRGLLIQAQEHLVEGMWIKYTEDPGLDQQFIQQLLQGQDASIQSVVQTLVQAMQASQSMGPAYKHVTSQHLDDGYDYEVEFDVMNATPAAMQAQQQAFVNFLALLANPMVIMSPAMIREAAYRVGYRNEAIIKQAQQVAQVHAQMQAMQMAQGPGQGNNSANSAKTRQKQMATPGMDTIQNQINGQIQ